MPSVFSRLFLQALDAKLLQKHKAHLNCKDTTMGYTALHYAAAFHNVAAAKQVRHVACPLLAVVVW
jgi:hypothetical protein